MNHTQRSLQTVSETGSKYIKHTQLPTAIQAKNKKLDKPSTKPSSEKWKMKQDKKSAAKKWGTTRETAHALGDTPSALSPSAKTSQSSSAARSASALDSSVGFLKDHKTEIVVGAGAIALGLAAAFLKPKKSDTPKKTAKAVKATASASARSVGLKAAGKKSAGKSAVKSKSAKKSGATQKAKKK